MRAFGCEHGAIFDTYLGNAACNPVERDVTRCGTVYAQAVSEAESSGLLWGVLQGVGFGLGGALAVTSVVLFATEPAGRPAATTRVRCGQGPGTVGVECAWRF